MSRTCVGASCVERSSYSEKRYVSVTTVGKLVPTFSEIVEPLEGEAGDENGDIHVGKLMGAMKRMESHMRNVGMKQGANDVAHNIEKVMRLYNRAPSDKRDSMLALLRWEMEMDARGRRQKINESSAAMGFKWLGHGIRYQYTVYRLLLEESYEPVEAATHAFEQHVRPHLPRLISMVANASIPRLVPSTQSSFFSMVLGISEDAYGPQEDTAIRRDITAMVDAWKNLLDKWNSVFLMLDLGTV